MKICSIPSCNTQVRAKNLCKHHYNAHAKGTLFNYLIGYETEVGGVVTTRRLLVGRRPRHENPTYNTMHMRIRRERGSASNYMCVDGMDHSAEDWSLEPGEGTHTEWNDKRQRWYPYSTDMESYKPRCKRHHRILDAGRGSEASHRTADEPVTGSGE